MATKNQKPALGPNGYRPNSGRPRKHTKFVGKTISFDESHIGKLADLQHAWGTENRSVTVCKIVDEAHAHMLKLRERRVKDRVSKVKAKAGKR